MTGRILRHTTLDWPNVSVGLLRPANPHSILAADGRRRNDTHTSAWPSDRPRPRDADQQGCEAPLGTEDGFAHAGPCASHGPGIPVGEAEGAAVNETLRTSEVQDDDELPSNLHRLVPPLVEDNDDEEIQTLALDLAQGRTDAACADGGAVADYGGANGGTSGPDRSSLRIFDGSYVPRPSGDSQTVLVEDHVCQGGTSSAGPSSSATGHCD